MFVYRRAKKLRRGKAGGRESRGSVPAGRRVVLGGAVQSVAVSAFGFNI